MAAAGAGMAPRFWVLRCCSCRLFQVQQAKRSGKWSCNVCGQRQTVQKIYGQGTGLDCRHHVQKLNLLQGEAEEAIGWTFRCMEDSVNGSKNRAAQHEDSLVQQERKAEGSRWSKYLDKDSEDQEVEEEADAERQQFCCQRRTVEEQRKQQKSFLSGDVQEYAEENGVFQLAYQAKKHNKCLVAVPDPGDGGVAASGDTMVPAVCESVVPEETTQTPAASIKPSKWKKFLSSADNYSGNAAGNAARVTLLPQEGSGRLGLHSSTTAADAGRASGCSGQAGKTLPRSTVQFKKHSSSTEGLASKLPGTMVPSTGCSAEEEMLFKEPQSQLIRAGSGGVETTGGGCCLDSMRRANTLANCNSKPQPSNHSYARLFSTGDEFDDNL